MSQVLGRKSPFKTPAEMERIREADARQKEKDRAAFVPEKNAYRPLAYFEIARYTQGPLHGLFAAFQLITKDAAGKDLKKPERKTVADGVDMVVLISSLETAIRRRVFK